MPALRDTLRASLLATPTFRSTIIQADGKSFEVREPTVAGRAAIFRASKMQNGDFDNARVAVEAVIACTYVPGTNERVFEAADLDALLAQPLGTWFDEFQRAAMAFINGVAAAAKNSKATESAK